MRTHYNGYNPGYQPALCGAWIEETGEPQTTEADRVTCPDCLDALANG